MFLKSALIYILFLWKLSSVSSWNIPIPCDNQVSIQAINQIAVEMIWKCYSDNREIVIHGDADQLTIKSLRESATLPVIIFNNDIFRVGHIPKLRLHHNTFVVTPRSIIQLEGMLQTFEYSERWNVMAPYFILDRSNEECKNAREMLEAASRWNLVKSFFVCVDSDRVPKIYSYNPYTNRAPKPWEEVLNTTKQAKGWTMYVRRHSTGKVCNGVNFDRTEHLDSATIRIAFSIPEPKTFVSYTDYNETIKAEMLPEHVYEIEMIKYSLNVTPIFNIFYTHIWRRYLQDGSYDVILNDFWMRSSRLSRTYPVEYLSYHIVTNNRGFYTPLERIGNFFGMVTLVSMCVILAMIYIVIVLSEERRRWAFAACEILRLLINTALRRRMDRLSQRIFFSVILSYFLIIQAMFRGHLVTFLTKQEYRSNAQTLEDLQDSRYDEVHVAIEPVRYMSYSFGSNKFLVGMPNCIPEVIKADSRACITTRNNFIFPAFEYQMHVSKNPVFILPDHYYVRKDWPLEERFNLFLMRLESSGQSVGDWKRRNEERILETQKRKTAMAAVPEIRPISMPMLHWIFIFLLIVFKVAAISFTLERRMRPKSIRIADNRLAAQQNMERRRSELLNQIITDNQFPTGFRPRSSSSSNTSNTYSNIVVTMD